MSKKQDRKLVVFSGPPCSGKSTLGQLLSARLGMEYRQMDQIRKRLFPESQQEAEHRKIAYAAMHMIAEEFLTRDKSMIVDATYGPIEQRKAIESIAQERGAQLYLIECKVPVNVAVDRFVNHRKHGEHPAVDLTSEKVASLVQGFPYFGKGLTLDTTRTPEECLQQIEEYLAHGEPIRYGDWSKTETVGPIAPQDSPEMMKEWETLRAETLQSQSQRMTAFQVSISLFSVLYAASLSSATGLKSEPHIVQAFLLVLLLPFVEMIRRLRLRDYYQACYISDFIRPKLPNVRYTVRNQEFGNPEFGRPLRDKASSSEAMKWTYLWLGLSTTLFTFVLGALPSATSGMQHSVWGLWIRAIMLSGVVIGYVYFVMAKRGEGDWKNEVFTRFRRIAVHEILSGDLQPRAFVGKSVTDPAAWDDQYGREREKNKSVTLKALTACLTKQSEHATVDQLRTKWKLPR